MDTRTTIIAVIILAILVAVVLFRIFYGKNKENAKEEALKFLNTLADKFESIIIKHIKDIDFKNLDNLSELEKKILDETIGELWTVVQDHLTTYATSDPMRELLRVVINKDFLLNFITQFFKEDKPVQEAYEAKYNDAVAFQCHKAEMFEKDTAEKNYEYQTEDLSKEEKVTPIDPNLRYDFTEGTRENHGTVIEKELNPQTDITDEELTYSTEDN